MTRGITDRRALDTLYSAETLAERQQMYPRFFRGAYDEMVQPRLTADEKSKLAAVRFVFPLNMPGREPFGFRSGDDTVYLSISSLKLINDLLLAYCWLGRNDYKLGTIDDYLLMLARWPSESRPPEPLAALGVPPNARDDPKTDELANDYVKRTYLFILLHELGHLLYGDPPAVTEAPMRSQAEESRADQFALDVLGRCALVGTGITQFFEWAWAFMPNPADYADEAAYRDAVLRQTHPLTTERLRQVAIDMESNAKSYARDHNPETLAAFDNLSRMLRKLAALKSDPDMQRFGAQRGKAIEPQDLAPRRHNELIGIPAAKQSKPGPFNGKLVGTLSFGTMSVDFEVVLQNQSDHVTGIFATQTEIGHLDGIVTGNALQFAWRSGEQRGAGVLRLQGGAYEGTAGPAVWRLSAPH